MQHAETHPRFMEGAVKQVTLGIARAHTLATVYGELVGDLANTRRVLKKTTTELEAHLAAEEDILSRRYEAAETGTEVKAQFTAKASLLSELQETKSQAIIASRKKAAALAHMGEELRISLVEIQEVAESLKKNAPKTVENTQYEDHIDVILNSSQYLLDHLDGAISISDIEPEFPSHHFQQLDLHSEVAHSLSLVAEAAEKKGIRLETAFPKNRPSVWADKAWLEYILCFSLEHAIGRGNENSRVVVAISQPDQDRVAISISGQGADLPHEEVEAALNFFETDTPASNKRDPGPGLGLSISKRFAEIQGGKLSIESAPNWSTIVTVQLLSRECKTVGSIG